MKAICEAVNLTKIIEIATYPPYSSYVGFMKPIVCEVLTQIPKEYADKVTVFEIYAPFFDDIDEDLECYILKTILYTGVIPEEVLAKEIIWQTQKPALLCYTKQVIKISITKDILPPSHKLFSSK